jgi:hypothetical protein
MSTKKALFEVAEWLSAHSKRNKLDLKEVRFGFTDQCLGSLLQINFSVLPVLFTTLIS